MRIAPPLAAVAASATLVFLSRAALAGCSNEMCSTSQQEGDRLIVTFSTTMAGVTHYNFVVPRIKPQVELRAWQTQTTIFIPHRPMIIRYSLQACSGGFLKKSTCTPWANFAARTVF